MVISRLAEKRFADKSFICRQIFYLPTAVLLGAVLCHSPRPRPPAPLATALHTVCELLCNLIGSSTSRLLVVGKKKAECFAKMINEQEIRELFDNTTPKIPCLFI